MTYTFFSYAYISVFCFGGALMSLYIVYVAFRDEDRRQPRETWELLQQRW